MTSATDNLKPCPFCGGEAEIHRFSDGDFSIDVYHEKDCIMCIDIDGGIFDGDDYEWAIEAWNTRAERTCSVVASYSPSDMDEDDEWYFAFSCGHELYWDEREPPKHCPECGRKVVGE